MAPGVTLSTDPWNYTQVREEGEVRENRGEAGGGEGGEAEAGGGEEGGRRGQVRKEGGGKRGWRGQVREERLEGAVCPNGSL